VLPPRHAAQSAVQARAAASPSGTAVDARANAALGFVVELAIRGDDRLQMVGAPLRGHQREKILRELRNLKPCRELGRDVALGRRGTHGRAKKA